MATSTASVETAVRGRNFDKQQRKSRSPVLVERIEGTCDAAVFAAGLGAHGDGNGSTSVPTHRTNSYRLCSSSTGLLPSALLAPDLGVLQLLFSEKSKNKVKENKQALIYFLIFRHSDSGQTSPASIGGQNRDDVG